MLDTLRKELSPEILLTNRQGTAKKLAEWAAGNPGPLAVRATSPREVVDVFAAWVHALPIAEADAVASPTSAFFRIDPDLMRVRGPIQ
jgi:hypothetical protein